MCLVTTSMSLELIILRQTKNRPKDQKPTGISINEKIDITTNVTRLGFSSDESSIKSANGTNANTVPPATTPSNTNNASRMEKERGWSLINSRNIFAMLEIFDM